MFCTPQSTKAFNKTESLILIEWVDFSSDVLCLK